MYAGAAATDDLHDMTIKNGRMYTSNITNGITEIYDVSNMSATVAPTITVRVPGSRPPRAPPCAPSSRRRHRPHHRRTRGGTDLR